jgi:NADH-quinone oxidoreductase subunit G
MCDHGRLNYRWMNRKDRVDVRWCAGGVLASADWEIALRAAAALLSGKRAFVLASPNLSNEALFLLGARRRRRRQRRFRVPQGRGAAAGRRGSRAAADRAANGRARSCWASRAARRRCRDSARVTCSSSPTRSWRSSTRGCAKAGAVIVIGTTLPAWARHAANVVLPIANCTEEEGTFTNLRGRVQRFCRPRQRPGWLGPATSCSAISSPAAGEGLGLLDGRPDVRRAGASRTGYAGLSYDGLGLRGR